MSKQDIVAGGPGPGTSWNDSERARTSMADSAECWGTNLDAFLLTAELPVVVTPTKTRSQFLLVAGDKLAIIIDTEGTFHLSVIV